MGKCDLDLVHSFSFFFLMDQVLTTIVKQADATLQRPRALVPHRAAFRGAPVLLNITAAVAGMKGKTSLSPIYGMPPPPGWPSSRSPVVQFQLWSHTNQSMPALRRAIAQQLESMTATHGVDAGEFGLVVDFFEERTPTGKDCDAILGINLENSCAWILSDIYLCDVYLCGLPSLSLKQ